MNVQYFSLKNNNKLSELLTAASRDRDRASLAEKEADLLWDPPKIRGWLKALSVGGWQDGWWISVELWAVQLLCQDWKQRIEKAFFSPPAPNTWVQAAGGTQVWTLSQERETFDSWGGREWADDQYENKA